MATMTLDERLQKAYPNGAPLDVAAFLRGQWVANMQGVSLSIKALADEARREQGRLFDLLQKLQQGIVNRRNELAEAQAALTVERLCAYPLEALIVRVNARNALTWVVERLENELEITRKQYDLLVESGHVENWQALSDLAAIRIKDEIPAPTLAAKFNVTPEEMTPPARWARHLKQEQERIEYEEQRRRERETRRQEMAANAEPYTPPAPLGCPICDHEKSQEIHRRIYAEMPQSAIDTLRTEYGLPNGAISEHWNGHPNLRAQSTMSSLTKGAIHQ